MKRTRHCHPALRLLPLLVLWAGWTAAFDGPEPPASGPATGERLPEASPLLEVALPSLPALRGAQPEAADRIPAGPAGGAVTSSPSAAALHPPETALAAELSGTLHSRREQDSNRVRGPPVPID